MPKITTDRDDIIRAEELKAMFELLGESPTLMGVYETHLHGEEITQKVKVDCRMAEALISMLWIFGKRITEIVRLRRGDVELDEVVAGVITQRGVSAGVVINGNRMMIQATASRGVPAPGIRGAFAHSKSIAAA